MDTTGKIKIAGALTSIDDKGIVVYSGDVYDAGLKKTQREINELISDISGSIDGISAPEFSEGFSTNITVGGVPSGTEIKTGDLLATIIKLMLYSNNPTKPDTGTSTSGDGIKYRVMSQNEYSEVPTKLEDTFYFIYGYNDVTPTPLPDPATPTTGDAEVTESTLQAGVISDSVMTFSGSIIDNVLIL